MLCRLRRAALAAGIVLCAAWPAHAQVAISALPGASVPLCSEAVPLVQSGTTKQAPACAFGIPYQGTSAPTPLARYQLWADTSASPTLLKMYDGASWVAVGTINLSTHAFTAYPLPGAGLQVSGTSLSVVGGGPSKVIQASGTSLSLGNTDCPATVKPYETSEGTITFQGSPPAACDVLIPTLLQSVKLNFNGNAAKIQGYGDAPVSSFRLIIPATGHTRNGYVDVHWDTQYWRVYLSDGLYAEHIIPLGDPILSHGQVQLSHDAGNSRMQLCEKRGEGGVIVNDRMHKVPAACLWTNDSNNTSSVTNYYYLTAQAFDLSITNVTDNGSSHPRLTAVLSGTKSGDQCIIWTHSINGVNANVSAELATIPDGLNLHVDLPNVTMAGSFTSSPNASIRMLDCLSTSTTAPTETNGILGNGTNTFVGKAAVGAAHAVNVVYSQFNPVVCGDGSDVTVVCNQPPLTVANLGTCSAANQGARGYATDANTTVAAGIGTVVAAGGANKVPVNCNSANWLIGMLNGWRLDWPAANDNRLLEHRRAA